VHFCSSRALLIACAAAPIPIRHCRIDEPAGENPPDGAVIDYALPQGTGPVTLEILDGERQVGAEVCKHDAPEATMEELSKQLIPLYWLRMPKTLPATPGMHRWVWDLHYTTPTATNYEYPISAVPHDTPRTPQGPLALPGTYTVRLTAGGKSADGAVDRQDRSAGACHAGRFAEPVCAADRKLAAMVTKSASASLEVHSAHGAIGDLSKSAPSRNQGSRSRNSTRSLASY
jgi:hypothetical protein